ncbi:MAG TPA: WD40 repeat domain-containing protein, partial [Pyrinomonadaceae bacterium]|nr:WD40 repeat domain-containing protein [Pyrinomonadaceae bacterium]
VSKLLAVQRNDGSLQIVDITDGREQTVVPTVDKELYDMQWTHDGLRLLTVNSKSAALWDARTGARLTKPFDVPPTKEFLPFSQVTLSPDEKHLLNVKQDNSIRATAFDRDRAMAQVWSVESGQLKFEMKIDGRFACAEFSPNGKQILTTSEKGDPRLWDVETGRLFVKLKPPYPAAFGEASQAEFTPDGRYVVHRHETGIYIWHSSSGAINTRISYPHDTTANTFRGFTPDGKMFVMMHQTYGWDMPVSIELRDCETGELRLTLSEKKWGDWPNKVLWSNDARTLVVTSGHKYKARIWDVASGKVRAKLSLVLSYSRIPFDFGFKDRDELALHPTMPVMSGTTNKFIRLWNTDTGELMQTIDRTNARRGEWSSDGKLFLTFAKDFQSAEVWDVVGQE